jgi:hypothetical protein
VNDTTQPAAINRPVSVWAKLGTVLMISSLPIWPLLLLVPFLPLSVAARGAVGTGMVILAEVMFWGGAALAGPEAARRVRSWWRRPRSA